MSETALVLWSVTVWVLVLALSVLGGALVTPWVLRAAARDRSVPDGAPGTQGSHGGEGGESGEGTTGAAAAARSAAGGTTGAAAVEALRGGTWIGLLERLAITGCLLAGYPGGIAFVVAVKGLGRYPELREHPVASERFVIGTLASMCWSAACGVAGAALLTALSALR